ncbi:polyhydroxyalkanoic acid system family protein [Marinobacter sp. M1N3S26]|uniref:polyhydroxyalkanoic acid system family protein n=1 Tax=unclassified Marinobacter TaxID=83889 RepID=UPI00387AB211
MSAIDVRRSHSMDQEHAREAAESLARDLSRKFDVQYEWDGDLLRFHRSGVKGHLDISPSELHVHLELGIMLRPFKGRVEEEIHNELDRIIV